MMELWMAAAQLLYLIPVIWFINDFNHVVEFVRDTFPTMKEGHVSVAILVILFWPITAIAGILLGGDE
jgi:hypothetical protein